MQRLSVFIPPVMRFLRVCIAGGVTAAMVAIKAVDWSDVAKAASEVVLAFVGGFFALLIPAVINAIFKALRERGFTYWFPV